MPMWRPDPTFYPSPKMAMQAPAEKLAFVAMLNAKDNGRPDALGVVDVDPLSTGYGHLVGQLDMPNAGDELHHFGWNACSACLCPHAPHPHVERRYLVVPGIKFRCSGEMGTGARSSIPGLRFLVAFGVRHRDHQRMGNSQHGAKRSEPRDSAERRLRSQTARVGSTETAAPAWPRVSDGAGVAAGTRSHACLWFSGRGGLAERSLGVDLGLASRQRNVER